MSIKVAIRHYLSTDLIVAAKYMADQAGALEAAGDDSVSARQRHRAYVMGAILTSAAYLEAMINELFADASKGQQARTRDLEADKQELLGRVWQVPKVPLLSALEKYHTALKLLDRQQLDKKGQLYQHAADLITLRNALVHFAPETVVSDSTKDRGDEAHRFDRTFRGRFPDNPLISVGNPFWPDKCLGYGCANWAVEAVQALVDDFYTRLGSSQPVETKVPSE